MWPDGYYYQHQRFYNYRWTKEMEQTFVESLLQHVRHGSFHAKLENKHAIHCALRAVNSVHGTRVTAAWAYSRVIRLKERYEVFNWLINRNDVVWNRNLRFVTAVDSVWEEICREKSLVCCYINTYEDMFEDLCVLFGEELPNEQVVVALDEANPAPVVVEQVPPVVAPVIDLDPPIGNAGNAIVIPPTVLNILSDSSDSSDEFWRVIEENYASEDNYASDSDPDSVLALPRVPSITPGPKYSPLKSPSSHSQGAASSSASNATPLKKKN